LRENGPLKRNSAVRRLYRNLGVIFGNGVGQ
jgi:hypothetical protein